MRWLRRAIAVPAVARKKEREERERYKKSQKRHISPIRGEAPCEKILTKFYRFGDMPDVIICANFGMEKLRGLGNTGVKVSALPLKRLVTLTTVLRYRTHSIGPHRIA